MLRNLLLFSAAMLLLNACSGSAMSISCGDMSPEDCKKEVSMEMDRGTMMLFIEMMKTQLIKMIDLFTAVKNEIPDDTVHGKMVIEIIDEMKAAKDMLDKTNEMDMEKTGATLLDAYKAMHTDFKRAIVEDKASVEKFKEIMDKHYNKDAMEEGLKTMLRKFETLCAEMLNGLRSEDIKAYPQYMELKQMMKTMMENTDDIGKMTMFLKMMEKMTTFMGVPHMKTILTATGGLA